MQKITLTQSKKMRNFGHSAIKQFLTVKPYRKVLLIRLSYTHLLNRTNTAFLRQPLLTHLMERVQNRL